MIDDVALHREELWALCQRHHERRLDLFGSAARGDFGREQSDLDFLVEFDRRAPEHPFDAYSSSRKRSKNFSLALLILSKRVPCATRTSRPASSETVKTSMQRDGRCYLWDALRAAESVRVFVRGKTYEAFIEDDLVRSAVERQLQIIGEAPSQLARVEPRTANKLSELRRIIAFRNILVHGYSAIDYDTVWRLIEDKLPELEKDLKMLLETFDPSSRSS